jgi:predicted transcriptional regulator
MTTTHNFAIIVSGIDTDSSDYADRFFEAGCDDATIAVQKGLIVFDFDREARSFKGALISALACVEKAGANIERVEPDFLVSASEISKRAKLTRAAISHYASDQRGEGFPRPIARVTSENPLWDWAEVATWMYAQKKISRDELVRALILKIVNVILSEKHSEKKIGKQLAKYRQTRELELA